MNNITKILIIFACLFSLSETVDATFHYLGTKEFNRFDYPIREAPSDFRSMDGIINATFSGQTLTIEIDNKKVLRKTFPTFKYGRIGVTSFYDDESKKNFYKIILTLQNTNDRDNLYLVLVGFNKNKTHFIDYINLYDFYDPFGTKEPGFAGIDIDESNNNRLLLFLNNLSDNQEYRYYLEWNAKNNKFDVIDGGYVTNDRTYHHHPI